MAQPYVGEIRLFAGNYAPTGWLFCNGQVLRIVDYETLFQLIGTTYGGDGQTTFAVPDLRGRVPIHTGNGYTVAQRGGVESVTLNLGQVPAHTHPLVASTDPGTEPTPQGNLLAAGTSMRPYSYQATDTNMGGEAVNPTGAGQPHDNMQPYLSLSFIISLNGIYPSPT